MRTAQKLPNDDLRRPTADIYFTDDLGPNFYGECQGCGAEQIVTTQAVHEIGPPRSFRVACVGCRAELLYPEGASW